MFGFGKSKEPKAHLHTVHYELGEEWGFIRLKSDHVVYEADHEWDTDEDIEDAWKAISQFEGPQIVDYVMFTAEGISPYDEDAVARREGIARPPIKLL